MLAQNFKSAADLEITGAQKDALIKTLVLLETDRIQHVDVTKRRFDSTKPIEFDGMFSMACWGSIAHECGTVACIGGTAEIVGKVSFGNPTTHDASLAPGLYELFYARKIIHSYDWNKINTAQAARALRSYLTTGDARWDLAVA